MESKMLGKIVGGAKKNCTTFMAIGAVFGLGVTVYLSIKAAPRAKEVINTWKSELDICDSESADSEKTEKEVKAEKLEVNKKYSVEFVKTVWKPVLSGGITTGLILGGNSLNLRRLADISAGYEIVSDSLTRYRKKVQEEVGNKKAIDIEDKVVQDTVTTVYQKGANVIYTGHGDVLCLDEWSGRLFKSDIEFIRKRVNDLNYQLQLDMFITLNEFYEALDLPTIKAGESFGWNVEYGLIDIRYSSQLTPDGLPCLVLCYDVVQSHKWGDM